jgi:hypothetical protein
VHLDARARRRVIERERVGVKREAKKPVGRAVVPVDLAVALGHVADQRMTEVTKVAPYLV